MAEHMLTTVDNPYDPFEEFDAWDAYDRRSGYNTMAFVARVTYTSHELSEADQDLAIELAVLEIAQENVLGLYRLVESNNRSS